MRFCLVIIFIIISYTSFSQTEVKVLDTRNTNEPPTFYDKTVQFEFKNRLLLEAPGSGFYSGLMTFAPWSDNSGGYHHQINFNDGGIFYRIGLPNSDSWNSWSQILTTKHNINLEGEYGAIIKKDVYPFKSFVHYTDDGTSYGPAWIHTNVNGTTHPTMFLRTSGNSAHLRVNDALGLGPMSVDLGSYPVITTNTWISGGQGESSYFNTGGNVLIGKTTQTNKSYRLDVAGAIRANEIVVNTNGADFVFEKNYKLRSLTDLESFIQTNKHLPEIAPAKEMQTNGAKLGKLNTKLLQKIEELTLYTIDQEKKIKSLEEKNSQLETMNKKLMELQLRLEKLESQKQ